MNRRPLAFPPIRLGNALYVTLPARQRTRLRCEDFEHWYLDDKPSLGIEVSFVLFCCVAVMVVAMVCQGHAEGKKHKAKVKRAILEKEEALKASQPSTAAPPPTTTTAAPSDKPGTEVRLSEPADEKKKIDKPQEVLQVIH